MSFSFNVRPTYKELIIESINELTSLGVNFSNSIYFEESDAYSRYGTCIKKSSRHPDYDFTIRINKWIDDNDIKNLKTVIIHEILHTINFEDKHRGEWKAISKLVNEKLDIDIERTASIKLNYPKDKVVEYICPNCRSIFLIKKKNRRIYICKKCNIRIVKNK